MSRARDIANLQSSKITADAGIDIDNINIDGTEIDLSSGDLTIDVAGDITLDADGGNILFKDGGTEFLEFEQDGGGCTIRVDASNTDLKFVGNDAGSTITALTLDMSDAGAASFNAGVDATSFFRSPNFYTGVGSQGFVNVDTNNCKIVSQSGDVHMYFTNDGSAYMYYDAAEKLKTVTGGVDVTGRIVADTLVIGKDSADTTLSGGTPPLQVIGTGSAATIACVRREANAYGPSIILAKSRNTSVGSYTIVNDDDSLGSITFIGDDGTNLDTYGATIAANVDGTPGENDLPARLTFSTTADGAASPTERMRITSGGDIAINNSTSIGFKMYIQSDSGQPALALRRNGGSDGELVRLHNASGTDVGSIDTSSSSTSYNTSSDHRLKENVDYNWDATTRLKQLKPARFNFIADDTNTLVEGFLAHEAQEVVPQSVTGKKDEVDDDGNAIMQGIDHSVLVPLLVKTIQELEARIAKLEE